MSQPRELEQPAAPKRRRTRSRIVVHAGGVKTAAEKRSTAEVKITLSKARYMRLAAKRRWAAKLLANLVDTMEVAEREGRVAMLQVAPDGDSQVVTPAAAAAAASPLAAAIARANARGATKVADILKSPDMVTARVFGPLIGISHETVNVRRQKGELLGLEGPTRGFRYPRWQVTDAGLPLPGLAQVFHVLGDQPWSVYRFLRAEHAELDGRTALDALKAGQVDAVVGAAQNQATGAFA
jgi:hypothetical protein